MKLDYGFTITELENMIPFERDIHLEFILDRVREKNNAHQMQNYPTMMDAKKEGIL